MHKSILQCATSSMVKLMHFNYKHIHFLKNIASNKTKFCLYRPIAPKHFSAGSINFGQAGANFNTTNTKVNEALSIQADNDAISTELFEGLDINEITDGNEENITKFKLMLLEVDFLRQDGMKVPKTMSTEQWKELFSFTSKSQKIKYLKFLWLLEIKKLSDKRKKEEKKVKILEKRAKETIENSTNDHIKYGFLGCTIFLRIYETTINLHFNNKLVQAMIFGQNIVIDCGYDVDMSPIENKLCAKQLSLLFAENRKDSEPFNLHYCNVNRDSILFKQFKKLIPSIDEPHFPINIREEHYLDVFPKEKLVYLTPHCNKELAHFDHDDIYIIGALVDKQQNHPLSLAKAKSEGIRMAQLPLDRYLRWGLGTKSLTVNQVLAILLAIRTTGDWNEAFKHVPQRKIRQPGEPLQETRKHYKRGTTIMPPQNYKYERRNNRFY